MDDRAKYKKAASEPDAPDPRIEKVAVKIMNMTGGHYSRLARATNLIKVLIKEMKDEK